AIGQPVAPLVEADQPEQGTQTLKELGPKGAFPIEIQMREVARGEDEGIRAVAGDLVGDQDIAALGVVGFRPHPRSSPVRTRCLYRQPYSGGSAFASRQEPSRR